MKRRLKKSIPVLDTNETREELYEKALEEDVLIVYSVSTRVTKVKESFEKEYPGLCVEVRVLRSPDLIRAVVENSENDKGECDVVLCNDNSGDFKEALVNTGIVLPYMPSDIKPHMKEGYANETVTFVDEAELLFYNTEQFSQCPISNIWELTKKEYKDKIYIPNPLRSFSTYAFCSSMFFHEEELLKSYEDYMGKPFVAKEGESIAEVFFNMLCDNVIFTNSSDEVADALGNGEAYFGIMVSSKLRMADVGYDIAPIFNLNPFSGALSSFSVMLTKDSRSINSAKLFIRYLLGEEDGKGEGYTPFNTMGTWSARTDIKDGTDISLDQIDVIVPDQERLIRDKKVLTEFWEDLLTKYASK